MDSETEELTPRARAKRDQIRQAAQRLFLRDGYAGTSTDALVEEAGVSKQTLYAYYPSKEALLADVLKHLIRMVADDRDGRFLVTAPLRSAGALRSTLMDLAQEIVAELMQPAYLALVRVIITETHRLPQVAELFRSTVPERVLQAISDILENAAGAGLVRIPDPEVAARMFMGPLLTYVIMDGLFTTEQSPTPPPPERLESIVDAYLRAFLAAPQGG